MICAQAPAQMTRWRCRPRRFGAPLRAGGSRPCHRAQPSPAGDGTHIAAVRCGRRPPGNDQL